MKRNKKLFFGFACVALLIGLAPAQGAVVTLTSGNSVVDIDADASAGMFSWKVDGVQHLAQQWFWYRLGAVGGESPINTLSAAVISQSSADAADLTYTGGNGVTVLVRYLLTGGAASSNTSDVAETIRITNTSGQQIHFFQYTDFDLNGFAGDDFLVFPNANAVIQADLVSVFSETVIAPVPSHRQGDTFPTILTSLNDGNPTTLTDNPLEDVVIGPGDLTWAYQWDTSATTFIISKDKRLAPGVGIPGIPEPASVVVWGLLGLVGCTGWIRCRKV